MSHKHSGRRSQHASVQKYGALSKTHPRLATEWLRPVDGDAQLFRPDTVSARSGRAVVWRCAQELPSGEICGHEFVAVVADRTRTDGRRHGCAHCARFVRGDGKRRNAIIKHGSVADHPVLGPEFRGALSPLNHLTALDIAVTSNCRCRWECGEHPGVLWEVAPSTRWDIEQRIGRPSGCVQCSIERRRTWAYTQGITRSGTVAEHAPHLVAAWVSCPSAPEQTPDNTSVGSKLHVEWCCTDEDLHPHWLATVVNRTSNDSGCPACFAQRRKLFSRATALGRRGSLAYNHPDIAREYIRCLTAPALTAKDITAGSKELVEWRCHIHSKVYQAIVGDRVAGKSGCPVCGLIRTVNSIRTAALVRSGCLADQYPHIAAQWVKPVDVRHAAFTPYSVSPHSKMTVLWCCDRHGAPFIWPATIGNRTAGYGCPTCNASKGELAVAAVLTQLAVTHVPQYRFRSGHAEFPGLQKCRYDFALFASGDVISTPVGLIEFHGVQHYRPINFRGSRTTEDNLQAKFSSLQYRDQQKAAFARILGAPLLVIPYWQINQIEAELISFMDGLPVRPFSECSD